MSGGFSLRGVAALRALLIVTVICAAAALPCVIPLLIIAVDESVERVSRSIRRTVRRQWKALLLSRVARCSGLARLARDPTIVRLDATEPAGPPIQQIAADLRRLNRHRLGVATRSPVWFTAVQRAYDDRLRQASLQLRVEEHLTELEGIDLEVERVRVEGLLEAGGLVLRDSGSQPRYQRGTP